MTNETKKLIISLRESGKSYGEIVLITGVCLLVYILYQKNKCTTFMCLHLFYKFAL